MKSVCILLQNHYEIDIRVRRKAEALVAAGYSVDVLSLRFSEAKGKSYQLDGVNLRTFSLGKKRGSKGRYAFEYVAFLIWAFFRLSVQMRQRHYAVVDVNTLPDFLIFAACFARWKGAKLVLDMHEITPEFLMSKYGIGPRHWQVRLATWLERISARYAHHVITINEPIQKLLEERCIAPQKSTIIMNAADEAMFATASASDTSGQEISAKPRFVMMYHGTLTRIYGLDIAIEALALVHDKMPGAELWILGKGPEKEAVQALAAQRGLSSKVRLIGSVLPQEIPNWLKQCDVGVLATRKDVFLDYSFSNKLSEYIIMRKSVIASRLRTIRHYFSEDALAFFEPQNVEDLSRQMMRLYQDKALRSRLADNARLELEPIRWDLMKDRYLRLMASLSGLPADASASARVAQPAVISR